MTTNEPHSKPFGAGEHLLSTRQFDLAGLQTMFDLSDACDPIASSQQKCDVLNGALLGSLFFEPSTRTRLSFESAFERLGGNLTSTTGFTFSSMAKGESITDTARVVSGYSDVLVVRHPETGSVAQFAEGSLVPVVNAGDGKGEHPSQALLDTYTLQKELDKRGRGVNGTTVAVLGDLKNGRTVHSLISMLSLYENINFRLFSPPSLELPAESVDQARAAGCSVLQFDSVQEAVTGADAIYATRVQRERMSEEALAQAPKGGDLLNKAMLIEAANTEAILMHPLPRDSRPDSYDLSPDVDDLPGLAIFHQTDNGLRIRMAIFLRTLGISIEELKAHCTPTVWANRAVWSGP